MGFHQQEYRYDYLGMELIYRFHAFSLIDYPPERLRRIDNIFSLIMEAAWYHLNHHKLSDEERMRQKMKVVNRIRNATYPIEKIRKLIDFIKYYVQFQKSEHYRKFEETITKSSKPMGITEGILEQVRSESMALGSVNQSKVAIRNLHLEGMSISKIATILEMEIAKVEALLQEIKAEKTSK